MMLLEEMEKAAAFRSSNGECGWTREQTADVIAILRDRSLAILGGELWLVLSGSRSWSGLIPQREGSDAVYLWETNRYPNEPWATFVNRCAADSKSAVEKWPDPRTLSTELSGRILYNLTWVSEEELESSNRAG
jgi:hypothetical protein